MFSLSGRTTSMRYLRQRKQEIPMRKKLIAALSLDPRMKSIVSGVS